MCEVMEKICKLCVLMVIFIFCGILTTNAQSQNRGIYIFTTTTPTKVLYYHIRVIVESRDRGLYSSFGNLVPHLKKLMDNRLF